MGWQRLGGCTVGECPHAPRFCSFRRMPNVCFGWKADLRSCARPRFSGHLNCHISDSPQRYGAGMFEYRIYCLNIEGRFSKVSEVVAAGDAEALARARELRHSGGCEVWQGNRLVGTVEAHSNASSEG